MIREYFGCCGPQSTNDVRVYTLALLGRKNGPNSAAIAVAAQKQGGLYIEFLCEGHRCFLEEFASKGTNDFGSCSMTSIYLREGGATCVGDDAHVLVRRNNAKENCATTKNLHTTDICREIYLSPF